MKYIVANLKSNFTYDEVKEYKSSLEKINMNTKEVIVAAPFVYLDYLKSDKYILSSQNISSYSSGAYTGEINGEQLKSIGCEYTIIGHSERRKYFNESSEILTNKIKRALENELKVIFCIGETKEEYENKKTNEILKEQLLTVFNNFSVIDLAQIIIAYEPIWAIGTGLTPTNDTISTTINYIKEVVQENYHINIETLYGGSVSDTNIEELNSIDTLEGVLIGGASLDLVKLEQIINN